MDKSYKLGVLGCGDFLRWQESGLKNSKHVTVASLFDPDKARAEKFAADLGGRAVDSEDAIFGDADIDIVLLFVPPWIRRGQMDKAAAAGKHILTTKPLGPNSEDCDAMVQSVAKANVRCGVMYGRTGNATAETMKRLFADGAFGKLALYKQDWLHHYPQWNDWALDPEKNGGPFMDAMIHNMNLARYLMGRNTTGATFFGAKLSHDLPCNDTEAIKLDFEQGGWADLFITWAADLGVENTEGNYREHIDLNYMVTDQGYRITQDCKDGKQVLVASKDGKQEEIPVTGIGRTVFDRFAEAVDAGTDLPGDIVSVEMAAEDIRILRDTMAKPGQRLALTV